MDLTPEVLAPFVGGQLEVQNQIEEYLYRGEIASIKVENDSLNIKFTWLALLGPDRKWRKTENTDYSVSLQIISVSDIGEGRLHFSVMYISERSTLFPADGSKLDPKNIIGLDLAN